MTQPPITVWILGDQLLRAHPALHHAESLAARDAIRVLLVESAGRFARHPYHKKKQVLLISAMRHYAEWLRTQGYTVDYRAAPTMQDGLRAHIAEEAPARLIAMEASEYRGRIWQREHLEEQIDTPVTLVPNGQFLLSEFNPYPNPNPATRYTMEYFYRKMRRHFYILMDGDDPAGGQWNYDKQNRARYPDDAAAPRRMAFAPDATTQAVVQQVEASTGFGSAAGFDLAVTHEQAQAALDDFIEKRLIHFGIYEDAMTRRDEQLYHSLLSPYLNIGLLTPMQVINAAETAYAQGAAPINSVEGLVRQILGWREFMVWQYWRQMPDIVQKNAWNATNPLPEFFWSGATDMNCLKHVLQRVQQHGYAHHIERLMLLANVSTLLGLEPLQVNNWFLSAFVDAYEWVMIPNVLGMGLNADGGLTATKPYIASANYIHKMSDYCQDCPFNHKQRTGEGACPFNFLYWNFLLTHEDALRSNPRFGRAVLGLRHLDDDERQRVQEQAQAFIQQIIP